MTKRFTTSEKALIYMTECTLATVEYMMSLKKPKKSELHRQIDIAQLGVTYIMFSGLETYGRVKEVIENFDGSVGAWSHSCKET